MKFRIAMATFLLASAVGALPPALATDDPPPDESSFDEADQMLLNTQREIDQTRSDIEDHSGSSVFEVEDRAQALKEGLEKIYKGPIEYLQRKVNEITCSEPPCSGR